MTAEQRDWWLATGWSALLLLWLAGALVVLEHYYVFSRQDGSPVDGPVPDVLALLAVGVGVAVIAVMVGRARALAASQPAPRPAEVGRPTFPLGERGSTRASSFQQT